jgi:hypothetical protein
MLRHAAQAPPPPLLAQGPALPPYHPVCWEAAACVAEPPTEAFPLEGLSPAAPQRAPRLHSGCQGSPHRQQGLAETAAPSYGGPHAAGRPCRPLPPPPAAAAQPEHLAHISNICAAPIPRRCLASALWLQYLARRRGFDGSIPYIVLAQFRLELTKLSCLCLVNPLTNAHLPVPVPLGLGCSSARASGYGSVIDHRPDVKLGF